MDLAVGISSAVNGTSCQYIYLHEVYPIRVVPVIGELMTFCFCVSPHRFCRGSFEDNILHVEDHYTDGRHRRWPRLLAKVAVRAQGRGCPFLEYQPGLGHL